MPRSLARPSSHTYNRASVERGLTIHFGEGGPQGWSRNGGAGYLIPTSIGIVELKTLREAALFAIACAEKVRRLSREASA